MVCVLDHLIATGASMNVPRAVPGYEELRSSPTLSSRVPGPMISLGHSPPPFSDRLPSVRHIFDAAADPHDDPPTGPAPHSRPVQPSWDAQTGWWSGEAGRSRMMDLPSAADPFPATVGRKRWFGGGSATLVPGSSRPSSDRRQKHICGQRLRRHARQFLS